VDKDQALWNPDVELEASALRALPTGEIVVPDTGPLGLTPWSRRQLAGLLGIRWDKWFEKVSGEETAQEINRRLSRTDAAWKLRTRQLRPGEYFANGALAAIVSPTYTPIADERIIGSLTQAVGERWLSSLRVFHAEFTDRSTHLGIISPSPATIHAGDRRDEFFTGVYVRNSQVGFTALTVHVYFLRLVCSNGMLATDGEFRLLYRTHRPIENDALDGLMERAFASLKLRWQDGLAALESALGVAVENAEEAVHGLLKQVPGFGRYQEPVLTALKQEGLFATRFGLVQAMAEVARLLPHPDQRFEMERLAGRLLFASGPQAEPQQVSA